MIIDLLIEYNKIKITWLQ